MPVEYEKIDDNTMNIITPVVKTVTLSELRIYKSNAEVNKDRYLELADKEQAILDEVEEQITQAIALGIE